MENKTRAEIKVSGVLDERDESLSKEYGRYKRTIKVNYMSEIEDFVL